jgi:phosphonate transport system substrate-binding protein
VQRHYRHFVVVSVLVLTALFLLPCRAPAGGQPSANHEYTLGVFPFIPTTSIEGIFAPLAGEIGRAIGRPVKLRTTSSFEKFMEELRNRTYDIAFIQPFDYVDIARPGGYLPLVARNDRLSSHIVVKQDSPVKSLKDLKGKSLGMPPKVSAVSFMNRVALKKAGLNPDRDVTVVYLASHQACLQQMMIGKVDACGVSPPGVRLVEQQMKTSFRLIYETPEIPSPLFVVKKELPANEREIIMKTLQASDLNGVKPELRAMFLGDVKKPFRTTTEREYDVIRGYLKLLGHR